jgi:hypothetical protein
MMIREIQTRKVRSGRYEITRADGEHYSVIRGRVASGWVMERQSDLAVDGARTLEICKDAIRFGQF